MSDRAQTSNKLSKGLAFLWVWSGSGSDVGARTFRDLPCPYRKSNPHALMVQSTEDRPHVDAPSALNDAPFVQCSADLGTNSYSTERGVFAKEREFGRRTGVAWVLLQIDFG